MHRIYKLLIATPVILALVFLLSGCQANQVTAEDLLGTWYATSEDEYRTITFSKDGQDFKYSTENFFDRGNYQVTKDGTIKLVDRYKSICTLTPIRDKETKELVLLFNDEFISYSFTQEQRTRPSQTPASTATQTEKQQLFSQTVHLILTHAPWPREDGHGTIVFTDSTITLDSLTETFTIGQIKVIDGHYVATLMSPTGEYLCNIYPIASPDSDETEAFFPTSYRLEISYNGGPLITSTRDGYVGMSTN